MALLHRRNPAPRHTKYQEYKPYLREDFYYCCVYCTIHENENGGPRHFHVEHYRPKGLSRFAHLINDYQNLLYGCAICNPYKGDDWPSDNPLEDGKGYLEPCEHDYDDHFAITADYLIQGLTPIANYMIERLHLNRPQLQKLRKKRAEVAVFYSQSVEELTNILTTLETILNTFDLSDTMREQLQNSKEWQKQKLQQLQKEWAERWNPQYELDDYR